jgi:hypothetical protein
MLQLAAGLLERCHRFALLRLVMKLLQVISRDGKHLYGAMIRKQAETRRHGRGTFLRARARKRNTANRTVATTGQSKLNLGLNWPVEN